MADHPDEIGWGDNQIAVMQVSGKKVCLAKFRDELFAFTAVCPHAGGNLGEGCLTGSGHIVCPVHHYKFNIRNGYNVSGEGYYLTHWPVAIRQDGVFADFGIEPEKYDG